MAATKMQDVGARPAKGSDYEKKQKFLKKMGKGQAEELDALDEIGLRLKIVGSENNILNIKDDMEQNPEFIKAKEAYDLAKGPYDDAVANQKAVIGYALICLRDAGKLSDETDGLMSSAENEDDEDEAAVDDGEDPAFR